MTVIEDHASKQKATFFQFAFGESAEGFVCVVRREVGFKDFEESFFKYPTQLHDIVEHVSRFQHTHDLWYCPQLFSGRRRKKEYAKFCPSAWSDLDSCDPELISVRPSLVVESSPGRFQALWRFREVEHPLIAEDISMRIAYHHASDGADKSGWDLTQLLRVPYTYNHKYGGVGAAPPVRIIRAENLYYTAEDFEVFPKVEASAWVDIPMPDDLPTYSDVLGRYSFDNNLALLISSKPEEDWSKQLWILELRLFEAGLQPGEVYATVHQADCNKYERDGRSDSLLWRDVCRAYKYYLDKQAEFGPIIESARPILSTEEKKEQGSKTTIVEEYVEWASSLGDAAHQYHYAGIFTVLSSLLSSNVRLQTSFGNVTLNLWFMILADTTLTRKTTAMDIAMDLLDEIDPDAVLATDGSIEGMFSALSHRPGRSSIFLRDEFSGLLDSMGKKEYMAGMAEMLTKMYDGKYQKRILKRETIEVRDPVLIMFTGGIRNRIFELLNYDHVLSGFLPRFIFVTANADPSKLKPMGPPTVLTDRRRNELLEQLVAIYNHFTAPEEISINGVTSLVKKNWKVELTPEAWQCYNDYEGLMVSWAMDSQHRDIVMPTFDRLSKSGLKVAVMLACLRLPVGSVTVTEDDIKHAFFYIEQWRAYAVEVLTNIGKSAFERVVDSVTKAVYNDPGIARSALMQMFHMSSRQAVDVFNTLEERGTITVSSSGKGRRYYPPGGMPIEKAEKEAEKAAVDDDGTIHIKG